MAGEVDYDDLYDGKIPADVIAKANAKADAHQKGNGGK